VALELSGPKTTKTEDAESKEFEERMKNGDFGGLPGI